MAGRIVPTALYRTAARIWQVQNPKRLCRLVTWFFLMTPLSVIEIKRIPGENLTGKQYKLEIHYQPVIPAGKALPTNSHPRGSLRVRVKIERQ